MDSLLEGESLVKEQKESLFDSYMDQQESFSGSGETSLLGDDDTSSPVDIPEYDPVADKERRKAYFMQPEVQAEIVLDNYLKNKGYIVSGKEKRMLRREFLRNAKKGKYKKLFLELVNQNDDDSSVIEEAPVVEEEVVKVSD
jgi:hypothetical protein